MLLPDVNVLVALVWERHIHHAAARRWYAGLAGSRWATCSVTQTGFVRVSANPAAVVDAVSVREAVALLAALVGQPSHRFLADDRGFVDNPLVPHTRLVGHRQVTDAHLVAIARAHGAQVATFDQGMVTLGGDDVSVIDAV
jgi:toxin-antitoxin system PIN domain toxin